MSEATSLFINPLNNFYTSSNSGEAFSHVGIVYWFLYLFIIVRTSYEDLKNLGLKDKHVILSFPGE